MGWFSSSWQYRKSHVINAASGAGTNYQVKIVAHYGSGTDSGADVYLNSHSRTDFGDVRFTKSDGTTLLDYWMESYTASSQAIFWVEVADDLSTTAQTIYIYYGNPNATTTSNGNNTFLFFDDFDDNVFDTTKWDSVGTGTITEANGELKVVANAGAYGKAARSRISITIGSGVSVEGYYYKAAGVEVWWALGKTGTEDSTEVGASYGGFSTAVRCGYSNITFYAQKRVAGTATTLQSFSRTPPSSYVRAQHIVKTDTMSFYESGSLVGTWTHNVFTSTDGVKASISTWSGGSEYRNWIFVRKYTDPEPSHGSWGSEETIWNKYAEASSVSDFRRMGISKYLVE